MIDFVVGIDDEFTREVANGLSESYERSVPHFPLVLRWYEDGNVDHRILLSPDQENLDHRTIQRLITENTRGKTGLLVMRNEQGRESLQVEGFLLSIIATACSLLRRDRFAAGDLKIAIPMSLDQKADKDWMNDPRPNVYRRDHGKISDYRLLPLLLAPTGASEIVSFHAHPRHLRQGDSRSFEQFHQYSYEFRGDNTEASRILDIYGRTLTLRSLSLLDGFSRHVESILGERKPLVVSPEKLGGAGVRLAIDFATSLGCSYHQIIKSVDADGNPIVDEPFDAQGHDILVYDDFTKTYRSVLELLGHVINPGNVFMCFYHFDLTREGEERFISLAEGGGDYAHLPRPKAVIVTNSLSGDIFKHPLVHDYVYNIAPEIVSYFARRDS